jgi:hypothetical protein
VYQPPYEEYIINSSDESSFTTQIYNIVVARRLRPTLIRELKDKQHTLVGILFFSHTRNCLSVLCRLSMNYVR